VGGPDPALLVNNDWTAAFAPHDVVPLEEVGSDLD
jgi:hypothetical protein